MSDKEPDMILPGFMREQIDAVVGEYDRTLIDKVWANARGDGEREREAFAGACGAMQGLLLAIRDLDRGGISND